MDRERLRCPRRSNRSRPGLSPDLPSDCRRPGREELELVRRQCGIREDLASEAQSELSAIAFRDESNLSTDAALSEGVDIDQRRMNLTAVESCSNLCCSLNHSAHHCVDVTVNLLATALEMHLRLISILKNRNDNASNRQSASAHSWTRRRIIPSEQPAVAICSHLGP